MKNSNNGCTIRSNYWPLFEDADILELEKQFLEKSNDK